MLSLKRGRDQCLATVWRGISRGGGEGDNTERERETEKRSGMRAESEAGVAISGSIPKNALACAHTGITSVCWEGDSRKGPARGRETPPSSSRRDHMAPLYIHGDTLSSLYRERKQAAVGGKASPVLVAASIPYRAGTPSPCFRE